MGYLENTGVNEKWDRLLVKEREGLRRTINEGLERKEIKNKGIKNDG